MKIPILIAIVFFSAFACTDSPKKTLKEIEKTYNTPNFSLSVNEIQSIEFVNEETRTITTDSNIIETLAQIINNSPCIGISKGVVENTLNIYSHSKGVLDTIKISTLDSLFKAKNKTGDWTFKSTALKTYIDSFGEEQERLLLLKIKSSWESLTLKKGGCLTGGEYIRNGTFGNEGCVLKNSKSWDLFFSLPKNTLVKFLTKEMDNNNATIIHTCPFQDATRGEIAVYCLQKIAHKNWYDFELFSKFKNKEVDDDSNYQTWLLGILKNKEKRTLLKELFINEIK